MYVGKFALIHILLLDGNFFKYFIIKVTISFKKMWELEKRRTVTLSHHPNPGLIAFCDLHPEKFVLR